ncbi:MAG: SUF system Fe-S cluster assembly protein [Rhizomicrobium sp.]
MSSSGEQIKQNETPRISTADLEDFTAKLIAAMKTVYDPEIPVDIYELGLIYKVDVSDERDVEVDMTLTAPGCPVAGEMPVMVENALETVEGIGKVKINMVFDPPWTPDRMSEAARLELNMF